MSVGESETLQQEEQVLVIDLLVSVEVALDLDLVELDCDRLVVLVSPAALVVDHDRAGVVREFEFVMRVVGRFIEVDGDRATLVVLFGAEASGLGTRQGPEPALARVVRVPGGLPLPEVGTPVTDRVP